MLLLLLQLGCAGEFKVTEVDAPDTTDPNEPDDTPIQEPGSEPASEPSIDANDIDDDNDGYTENEGDCDDTSPALSPGNTELPYDGIDTDCNPITPDDDLDQDGYGIADVDCNDTEFGINPGILDNTCNDFDENCNGLNDEDWDQDTNESNDIMETATDLGSVDDDSPMTTTGYLYPDGDSDLFQFSAIDGWGWGFGFTLTLSNVPSGHNYALRVYRTPLEGGDWEEIDFQDEASLGDDEVLEITGGFGDDSGQYFVEVLSTTGPTCRHAYTIKIEN